MLGTSYLEILRILADTLGAAGKPWALIGGAALPARGRARGTRDLDLILVSPQEDMASIVDALRARGFAHHSRADRHRLERVILYRFWYPVSRAASAGVDIQVSHDPFLVATVERATTLELVGVRVPVATAEDLVLLKLLSFRPIDRADAIELVRLTSRFDDAYVFRQATELAVAGRWEEVQAAAGEDLSPHP